MKKAMIRITVLTDVGDDEALPLLNTYANISSAILYSKAYKRCQ